jgi:hypothetical protein
MVIGMTHKRTFSIPDDVSARLTAAAGGNASGFVTAAVERELDRRDLLAQLHELWGEQDPEARSWAEQVLAVGPDRDSS